MVRHPLRLYVYTIACLIFLTVFCTSCRENGGAATAFYYWKQNFNLNEAQASLLNNTGNAKLYLRFFDIKWDAKANRPYPEAVLHFGKKNLPQDITPVIFITNQTFEKLAADGPDSLAVKSNTLIEQVAKEQQLVYTHIQVDCDWTIGTKEKYFSFLKALKKISKKKLETTIRLHQVKYQFKTGVPPADRGVLMFYNMGKLSADPASANSIYNAKDAAAYVNSLPNYLLPLDIALPVFSWSLQIRNGRIIQVYGKIGRNELNNTANFRQTAQKDVYMATNSFFIGGIYVKAGDLFKLEESNKETLDEAAKQLAAHLNKKDKRTIIYYELGNLNLSTFKAADFKEISAYF